MSNKHYYLYLIGKFALIIAHHLLADYITAKYNTNDKTTTRDINWENIPDNVKRCLKQYYAICQILAINSLILTDNDKTGSGVMEAAFLVMFPIQLSTFLMTLVRKSIITNIYWHIFYSLSLVSPYFLIINTLRSVSGDSGDSVGSGGIYKNKLEIAKVYLPILYIIFRLQYNFNKYYLMFHIFIANFYIQYRNGLIVL
jgi:hypothetical protein